MIWHYMKSYTNAIDSYIDHIRQIDKVRVVFFITWAWAMFNIYTTKIFEAVFKLVLKLPDNWLAVPIARVPQNVRILTASNGQSDITNKFKLFLKYYCDKDLKEGGFSFQSLHRLMNCSMLYCSYLLTDKNGNIAPEQFWQNVDKFLIQLEGDQCVKYTDAKLSVKQEVPFGTVRFVNPTNTAAERNEQTRQDLLDFINSVDEPHHQEPDMHESNSHEPPCIRNRLSTIDNNIMSPPDIDE